MTQQDLTPPIDRIKVSRREHFSRAYEMLQDEKTPQDLAGYTFRAELSGAKGLVFTLTESAGITRPNANTVVVNLNTIQMGELSVGSYFMLLTGDRLGEREAFVKLDIQVE